MHTYIEVSHRDHNLLRDIVRPSTWTVSPVVPSALLTGGSSTLYSPAHQNPRCDWIIQQRPDVTSGYSSHSRGARVNSAAHLGFLHPFGSCLVWIIYRRPVCQGPYAMNNMQMRLNHPILLSRSFLLCSLSVTSLDLSASPYLRN